MPRLTLRISRLNSKCVVFGIHAYQITSPIDYSREGHVRPSSICSANFFGGRFSIDQSSSSDTDSHKAAPVTSLGFADGTIVTQIPVI